MIKTTNKMIFDTEETCKGKIITIKAMFDEKRFNGTYVVKEVQEDYLILYNLITLKDTKITINEFRNIREDYTVGDKSNKIEYGAI